MTTNGKKMCLGSALKPQQMMLCCSLFLYYLLVSSCILLLAGDFERVGAFQQLKPQYHQRRSDYTLLRKYTSSRDTRRDATLFNPRTKSPPSSIEPDDDTTYTIQILMSDTGGGHRASANALKDAFDSLYPGKIQCDIVDIFTDYGPFWPFNDYVGLYKFMAEYPFIWDWFYHFGATPFGLWLNEYMLEMCCFEPFRDCMNRPSGNTNKRADMVVSVHPLTQDIPLKILADLDSNGETRNPLVARLTPFATVVTDLGGAHPTWFNMAVDKCFVPSDQLYRLALERNLRPDQIIQHGLPIRKGFWGMDGHIEGSFTVNARTSTIEKKPRSKNLFGGLFSKFRNKGNEKENASFSAISNKSSDTSSNGNKSVFRKKLGLDCDLPAVLVVGGGDGMGGIVETAKCLGSKLSSDAQTNGGKFLMVVVCGNNRDAKSKLEEMDWPAGVQVKVHGFVNNMDEWMRACDVIVTKAGPGTIAEASICGLPCMLSSYLPGQEEGNIPYVETAGFGKFSGDPDVISETVSSWFKTPTLLEIMRNAALDSARPFATLCIAEDLAQILFKHKEQFSTIKY